MIRAAVTSAFALAALLSTTDASAQARDPAAADALFKQGRALVNAGNYKAACPKFEASYKLDPGLGALLNLALCHEKEGKIATAWSEYASVMDDARKAHDKKRLDFARKQHDALEPRLPKIILVAPSGVDIERDGVALGQGALGSELPIDPGDHQIQVTEDGKLPWSTQITSREGKTVHVTVPELQDAPKEAKPIKKTNAFAPVQTSTSLAPTGYVVGAFGAAGMGLGAVFAGLVAGRVAHAKGLCPDKVCNEEGYNAINAARTDAWVADVGLGLGAALVVTGAILVVTSPDDRVKVSTSGRGLRVDVAF